MNNAMTSACEKWHERPFELAEDPIECDDEDAAFWSDMEGSWYPLPGKPWCAAEAQQILSTGWRIAWPETLPRHGAQADLIIIAHEISMIFWSRGVDSMPWECFHPLFLEAVNAENVSADRKRSILGAMDELEVRNFLMIEDLEEDQEVIFIGFEAGNWYPDVQ